MIYWNIYQAKHMILFQEGVTGGPYAFYPFITLFCPPTTLLNWSKFLTYNEQ